MTDLGEESFVLGIEFHSGRFHGMLVLSRKAYNDRTQKVNMHSFFFCFLQENTFIHIKMVYIHSRINMHSCSAEDSPHR